ncbi:hypothetical protein ACOMHN_002103 [Nucella lapillus]
MNNGSNNEKALTGMNNGSNNEDALTGMNNGSNNEEALTGMNNGFNKMVLLVTLPMTPHNGVNNNLEMFSSPRGVKLSGPRTDQT